MTCKICLHLAAHHRQARESNVTRTDAATQHLAGVPCEYEGALVVRGSFQVPHSQVVVVGTAHNQVSVACKTVYRLPARWTTAIRTAASRLQHVPGGISTALNQIASPLIFSASLRASFLCPREEEEARRVVALVPGQPRYKAAAHQPVTPEAHTLAIVLPPARRYRGGPRQTRRAVREKKD